MENTENNQDYINIEVSLFGNTSEKIKLVASILCYVNTALYFIISIIMFISAEDAYDEWIFYLLGFVFLILGPLASWVSSLFIYGFGQLIENSDKLVNMANNKSDIMVNKINIS